MASAKIQRMSKSVKQRVTQKALNSDVPDEIQCKICRKRYEDPKLLSCLHTFCKACLEKNVETHSGALRCPVCQAEIKSADFTGVDNLQSNFMISNLLQAIDLKEGLSSKHCENCDEGAPAVSRCFECGDFLCPSCVDAHKRVRFTRNHRVVAIKNLNADSMSRTPTCATHSQEALKMYCKQCKKPVCRTCILNEHSDEHALISLKEAVDDTKPKLNTLLAATRARIPVLQRKLKEVHASKQKLETKVDDVIKQIQATSAHILMAVKRREKDLYKMLRRIHDRKSDELENRELALENDLAQVLDSCDFAEQLGKSGNEAMVLHASEVTCTRLRDLSGKDEPEVPEISEDEIEYIVDEKPALDQLKIYGKILSKEQKATKEIYGGNAKGNSGRSEKDAGKEEVGVEVKKPGVERKATWLQTLVNARSLIRRMSLGGDEAVGKKPEDKSSSKDQATSDDRVEVGGMVNISDTLQGRQAKTKPSDQQQNKQSEQASPDTRKRVDSISMSTEAEHIYAIPNKPKKSENSKETKTDPIKSSAKFPGSLHDPETPLNEPATKTPSDPHLRNDSASTAVMESPTSILKQPSTVDRPHETQEPGSPQAWIVRGGSLPSGAHSQSYLPNLCILTKNRRGRPREIEIQLESPDKSIVSAQILDHKNGTYTIFYCPLTPGEHNLYVNLGGKNIKHGKKVLNFYGKFSGMGTEELFLARRALSCIRWQVTPGFVELNDNKLKPNPNI